MQQHIRYRDYSIISPENQVQEGKRMENTYVNEKTLIGEVVNRYPEAAEVLFGIGMHCLGCPASQAESLEDACAVHGIEAAPVVKAVNDNIAESRK